MGLWGKCSQPVWLPKLLSVVRIAIGLLFIEHGLATWFGFFTGRPDRNFPALHAFAGPIETVGGALLILGLCTRSTAFILSGEMAVAYFQFHFPNSVWPTVNGGVTAVIYCFLWLYFSSAGAGPWSFDAMRKK